MYLINEFQRLIEEEQKQLGWNAKRELAKINYHIHTDVIKQNLIPQELTVQQISRFYATRLLKLNLIAIQQMNVRQEVENRKIIKGNKA